MHKSSGLTTLLMNNKLRAFIGFALLAFTSQSAMASWTCTGNCGTSTANGVVTAPPGSTSYGYVTTNGGVSNIAPYVFNNNTINNGGTNTTTNGSTLLSSSFSATAGQNLSINFNYVTSDGAGYPDYAWARLLNASNGTQAALLFTATTMPTGNTVPGQGLTLPGQTALITPNAILTPNYVPIIATGYSTGGAGPVWVPLGASSGTCWNVGCGYTGWVNSSFTITSAGTYMLQFGVVNANDNLYQSGLAFSGATIGVDTIPTTTTPVPEPETYEMLLAGLGLMGFMVRRKKSA